MSIFFPNSSDVKLRGIQEGLSGIVPIQVWNSKTTPLFDLGHANTKAIFLTEEDIGTVAEIEYFHEEFPHILLVGFTDITTPALTKQIPSSQVPFLARETHLNGKVREKYRADLLVIADNTHLAASSLLQPLQHLCEKYVVRIYSNIKQPFVGYLGHISGVNIKDAIASATAMLTVLDEWYHTAILNHTIPVSVKTDLIIEDKDDEWWDEKRKISQHKTYAVFAKELLQELKLC